MKTKLLVAAVLFFSFTVAAYAATQYQVGSTPVTTVVSSGKTEKTGDIVFEAVSSNYTVTGTITLTYPVAVSEIATAAIQDITVPVGDPGVTAPTISTVAYVPGSNFKAITFSITPSATTPALHYSFRLTGIRVDVAGNPGATPMSALISSTGNTIVVGQTNPQVINAQFAGIVSFTGGTAVRINTVTGLIDGATTVAMTATEGFVNAFGVIVASDTTQKNPQAIEVRLDKAVPAGISVAFSPTDATGRWALVTGFVGPLTSASGAAPRVYYQVVADTNVTAVETFVITATITANPALAPYTPTTLNATVSLAPVFDETAPAGIAGAAAVPRYAYVPVGSVPLISFFSPTTTLLVPFAYNNPPSEEFPDQPVYNTGFALSNTTSDPGFTTMGFDTAVEQSGAFTFYLYASDGTLVTVPSSALADKDILVNGALPTGTSYTVLLSELLQAAEAPQLFSGYIFVVCNFTNAHGEFFVTDFSTFTHGALMLVINGDRDVTAESLGN